MKWCLGIAAVLAAAWAAPGWAQFQDLIKQAERLTIERDQPVTLSLQGVTAKEAVEKLVEATQSALACSPALAGKKVNVIARERSARQVCEGLARAVGGRWRKEGEGFLLEPVDPLEALTASELASELRLAFLQPGTSSGGMQEYQVERKILEIFAPVQVEAMAGEEGVAFAQLSRPQQERLAWLLNRRSSSSLQGLSQSQSQLGRLESATVRIQRQEGEQVSTTTGADGKPVTTRKKVVYENMDLRWPQGGQAYLWMPPKQ